MLEDNERDGLNDAYLEVKQRADGLYYGIYRGTSFVGTMDEVVAFISGKDVEFRNAVHAE